MESSQEAFLFFSTTAFQFLFVEAVWLKEAIQVLLSQLTEINVYVC